MCNIILEWKVHKLLDGHYTEMNIINKVRAIFFENSNYYAKTTLLATASFVNFLVSFNVIKDI